MSELQTWIDLETTGLSAENDVILEIGLIVTDKFGKELASFARTICEPNNRHWVDRVFEVENAQNNDFPDCYVRDMHRKSGLWRDINEDPDVVTLARAEHDAIGFLIDNGVQYQEVPLFGSSIGSLDRPFVLSHMPHLNDHTHYRNMDNSSIKILVNTHRPDLADMRDELLGSGSSSDHRVLGDCRFSIAEYQFYMKHFLKVSAFGEDE
jgi:oligoribonuclease